MSRRPDVRAEAAQVIARVAGERRSLGRALAPALRRFRDPRDRALVQAISYGVVRLYPRLDCVIEQLLDRPIRSRDLVVKSLLMAGIYQIGSMNVPDHAAVAETVAAAGRVGRPRASGLVNAVLRRYLRERSEVDARALENSEGRWAHPRWLIERLAEQWPDRWESILETNNTAPPMWLRVNRLQIDRHTYLENSAPEGATGGAAAPESVLLARPMDVEDVPGFDQGLVSVQDAGAQLAAHLLGARPGERILDACAAPGGKAAHILELCPQTELDALELDGNRRELMHATFDRLGLGPRVIAGDAAQPQAWWDGKPYHRILVDAPCTASGVIRRHPDIKLLRRESDVAQLAGVQGEILEAAWSVLRPGGRLLYATCSVWREENERQVSAFLQRHEDAAADSLEATVVPGVPAGAGRQILPGDAGMDGFYYACLTKAL